MLRFIKNLVGGKSGEGKSTSKASTPQRGQDSRGPAKKKTGQGPKKKQSGEARGEGEQRSGGGNRSRNRNRNRNRSGREGRSGGGGGRQEEYKPGEKRSGPPRKKRSGGSRSRGPRRREERLDDERSLPKIDPRPETPRLEMDPNAELPAAFAELGLSDPILHGTLSSGYETPTPVQAQAIPLVLEGKDVIGASQTGTGKTAAFGLPILSKLGSHGELRCLILEPVRELAAQVEDAFLTFSAATDLRTTLLHGGVSYGKQNEGLMLGSDIVVATPGRLLDHLERGTLSLNKIEFLVLDEVDRMLDMGFLPDVRKIINKCPQDRQTLFFSATMPPQIDSLAKWALRDPAEVEIGRRISAAETVSHYFYPVASTQREELLLALLEQTEFHSVMIFTRTKRDADMLFSKLKASGDDHKIAVLHSDIRQSDRTKALTGFREGAYEVIIATDLAARGLDISNVTHVINYQVPENSEDYVHRIGRTGRAQKEGDAFTLLSADELDRAQSIERLIGQKIEHRKIENFDYVYTTLLDDDAPNPDRFKKKKRGGKKRRR